MAIWGRPGSKTSLILRFLQSLFAGLSLGFILSGPNWVYYSDYWALVLAMAFNAFWSLVLFLYDVSILMLPSEDLSLFLLTAFMIGDWVVGAFTLAATTLSAVLTVLFVVDTHYCKYHIHDCKMYVIFVALGFVAWLFTAMSALIMIWLRALV